jgi:hypothetical protein
MRDTSSPSAEISVDAGRGIRDALTFVIASSPRSNSPILQANRLLL